MATLINTIKCDLAKQARNQGQQDNVITLLQQFNQESLNKLDAINFDTCKPSVMPTVINGKRAFKITVERENCKYHFNVYVDQKILEYVYQLIDARFPDKIELTGEEDYEADEGEDFGFTLFKMEVENKRRIIFKTDFMTFRGERCMKASIWHQRGSVEYCIKRTPELERFLIDNNLVLRQTFKQK